MPANRPAWRSLERLEQSRQRLLARLAELELERHDAIVAELDDGATLTAIADRLGVTRQALTKYLDRRGNHRAS